MEQVKGRENPPDEEGVHLFEAQLEDLLFEAFVDLGCHLEVLLKHLERERGFSLEVLLKHLERGRASLTWRFC